VRRIVFICQVFYPDTTSTSQLFQTLLRRLAWSGWEIHVLCGFPTGQSREHISRTQVWEGINIHRCGLPFPVKTSLIYRSFSYLSFFFHSFYRLLFHFREFIWLGVTNPPFNAHMLALASRIHRHDFSYFFLDLYPEGLLALGKLSLNNPITRIWTVLNGLAYRRADKLFVLGRDMLQLLEKRYELDSTRTIYIPHWSVVEPTRPKPFGESRFIKTWGIEGKFTVQYSGNMGLWHDIDSLVSVAHILQHENDIHFVFIGDGIRKNAAMKLAADLGVTNIIWKDFSPINDLNESLSACHVSIISLRSGLEGVAVPCKLYGILASGRAVVAQVPTNSEIALTIEENNCGIIVEPNNHHDLARSLLHLKDNQQEVSEMGENAFSAYQEKYTVASAIDRLDKHLTTRQ